MKPKRKRAYYRALKRGEPWAVQEQFYHNSMIHASAVLYEPFMEPNPFLKLIGPYEQVSVPIEHGDIIDE